MVQFNCFLCVNPTTCREYLRGILYFAMTIWADAGTFLCTNLQEMILEMMHGHITQSVKFRFTQRHVKTVEERKVQNHRICVWENSHTI